MEDMMDDKLLRAIFGEECYEEYLAHYGVAHDDQPPGPGSPGNWGTGEHPYQRVNSFVGRVENLKKYNHLTDDDIANFMGFSNTELFKQRYAYERDYRGEPSNFCKYVDGLRNEKTSSGKRKYTEADIAEIVGVKDATTLKDNYQYSQAVWEKIPANYKIDSDFHRQIKELKNEGYKEPQIAVALGVTTPSLKARESIASNLFKRELIDKNRELLNGIKAEDGTWIKEPITNRSERARILGLAEPTLRSMENGKVDENTKIIFNVADILRNEMSENKYFNVGKGTAERIGCKPDRLKTAIEILKLEGYDTITVQVDQMGSREGNKTSVLTLVPPGTTYQQLKKDVAEIDDVIAVYNGPHSSDGGETFQKIEEPVAIDPKRIFIKYAEEGGKDRDGLIELRRGVPDLSLGQAAYAQVRIAVEGGHYLKGMALHTDNVPEGYDILLNSNKPVGTPPEKVFKELEPEKATPGNPFGTSIKMDPGEDYIFQRHYTDPETGEQKLSAINVVNAEGDWSKWSKTVASQMLAKQSLDVVTKQLDLSYDARKSEFDEIMSLTNPIVKQKLLKEFEQNTDKAAVDLKAVAFPGESTRVLIPYPGMKEEECYCPQYDDGEMVALVRYPHGGVFEIPLLTVNNKYKEAKRDLGNTIDAIGIHPSQAGVLSGADFDGDTVICIPVRDKNGNKITPLTTSKDIDMEPYKELQTFDTKQFKLPEDVWKDENGKRRKDPRVMQSEAARGKQMGIATNLIMDIISKGADTKDIVDAVKYSMVVVDSYKHGLDWKAARKQFRIEEIMKKYRKKGGSDTVMTQAKSPDYVYPKKEKSLSNMTEDEKRRYYEGEKIYEEIGKKTAYRDKEGELHEFVKKGKRVKSTRMAETDDPSTLLSDNPNDKELAYADFATRLKALAKLARKEMRSIVREKKTTDPEIKAKYKDEVKSLHDKKDVAIAGKPLENKAQAYANKLFAQFKADNPDLDDAQYSKQKARYIDLARKRIGAKQTRIDISDSEWEAIQAGALSPSDLDEILNFADMTKVRQLAMPRATTELPVAKQNAIKTMMRNGKTPAQIAEELGVSTSTVNKYANYTEIRHSLLELGFSSSVV